MPRNIELEDRIILFFIKLCRGFVRVMPIGVSLGLGRFIGLAAYGLSKRKHVAYKNLRAAFCQEMCRAEMKRIARRSVENMGEITVELLKIPDMDKRYIEKNIEIVGAEAFKQAYPKGQGVIFLTAHFGNWEILNITGAILDYPLVALARVQKHPKSDAYLNSLRTSKGSQIIYKGIPIREILRALKKGEVVGILSDQDGGRNGSFVRFFGRQSSSPSGAATFSLRTGAPIFPIFITRIEGSRHRIELKPALSMPEKNLPEEEKKQIIMQQFAVLLEEAIRRNPDQWLWAHRRWKSTPDRSVLILSDGKTGHDNQSAAVAEALRNERRAAGAQDGAFHLKLIKVVYKNKPAENFARALTFLTRGHLPFKNFLLRSVLNKQSYDQIMTTYADIVISCGSALVPVNIMASHENVAKSVTVMKPFCGTGVFDAVIVPRHDKIKSAKNVFVTDRALSLIDEKSLAEASGKLARSLKSSEPDRKKIGLLVGGDTESLRFNRALFSGVLSEVNRFLGERQSDLLATSSRRTPAWADEELKKIFGAHRQCPLLVIANEANREGVVPGILGLCDAVVVSGESMSMVSEAVSSGKKVIVFTPSEDLKLKPKYKDFLKRMQESGLLVQADSRTIFKCLEESLASGPGHTEKLAHDKEVLKQAVKRVLT